MSKFILTATDYGPMIVSGIDTDVGTELIVRRCHEPEVTIIEKLQCSHIWARQDEIGRPYCAECGIPWELRQ
jgi:hypothetical protein